MASAAPPLVCYKRKELTSSLEGAQILCEGWAEREAMCHIILHSPPPPEVYARLSIVRFQLGLSPGEQGLFYSRGAFSIWDPLPMTMNLGLVIKQSEA
jgi:hypothetical protein